MRTSDVGFSRQRGLANYRTWKNVSVFDNWRAIQGLPCSKNLSKLRIQPQSQDRRTQRDTQWIEFVFWLWGEAI